MSFNNRNAGGDLVQIINRILLGNVGAVSQGQQLMTEIDEETLKNNIAVGELSKDILDGIQQLQANTEKLRNLMRIRAAGPAVQSTELQQRIDNIERKVTFLPSKCLCAILQSFHDPVSATKKEMEGRIMEHFKKRAVAGTAVAFDEAVNIVNRAYVDYLHELDHRGNSSHED